MEAKISSTTTESTGRTQMSPRVRVSGLARRLAHRPDKAGAGRLPAAPAARPDERPDHLFGQCQVDWEAIREQRHPQVPTSLDLGEFVDGADAFEQLRGQSGLIQPVLEHHRGQPLDLGDPRDLIRYREPDRVTVPGPNVLRRAPPPRPINKTAWPRRTGRWRA
jgi:hypothetical protein